jgi:hypothetical protein
MDFAERDWGAWVTRWRLLARKTARLSIGFALGAPGAKESDENRRGTKPR